MATRFKTRLYTIPAGGVATLATILNSGNDNFISNITVRAESTNAGKIYWSDSGQYGGYLDAREAVSVDLTGKFVATGDLSFHGTPGDKIYITVAG